METGLTHELLLQAFERYNTVFWPWNWLVCFSALLAALLASVPAAWGARVTTYLLGINWLWSGVCFLGLCLAPAYPLAILLGLVFSIQGLAFMLAARRNVLAFAWRPGVFGAASMLLVLFALLGYPLWGYLSGASYPQIAILGASCPTAIFTFGLLLMTTSRVPPALLVIPFTWAVSAVVPIAAGMREDSVLLVGGVLATMAIVIRDRRRGQLAPGNSA